MSLMNVKRYQEAKSLLGRTLPVARRVLGDNDETTLRMMAAHKKGTSELETLASEA